jgi:hypothetical protein
MKRGALIICMSNSPSGHLDGPPHDYVNIKNYLVSSIGGEWLEEEIIHYPDPCIQDIKNAISVMGELDYSFIVFTGHGEFDQYNHRQHMEVMDGDITVRDLRTNCPRQTIIIDACRGFIQRMPPQIARSMNFAMESTGQRISTRKLFENKLLQAEEGLTVLYAASENQSALDTNIGAAYISSLIKSAKEWGKTNIGNVLDLKTAHNHAKTYMYNNYDDVTQVPVMNSEKRLRYFPFGVKSTRLNG